MIRGQRVVWQFFATLGLTGLLELGLVYMMTVQTHRNFGTLLMLDG